MQAECRGEVGTKSREAHRAWVIGGLVHWLQAFPNKTVWGSYILPLLYSLHRGPLRSSSRADLVLEAAGMTDKSDMGPAIEKLTV